MEILSKRLKDLRESRNLTQEKLGQLINTDKSTICYFEKGRRIPPLQMLVALANEFNVSLDYFVGHDQFAIAEDNEHYGIKMSKEEIKFIKEIRKEHRLYQELLDNPENLIDRMKLKL